MRQGEPLPRQQSESDRARSGWLKVPATGGDVMQWAMQSSIVNRARQGLAAACADGEE